MPSNKEKLKDAKVVLKDALPPEYDAIIEDLSPHEVDVLIKVKKSFEDADADAGAEPVDPGLVPKYLSLVRF